MANPEARIQIAIVEYLHMCLRDSIVQQTRNEHGKAGKAGMRAAVKNKAMGAVTGFPDLCVFQPFPRGAFFLEVKAPKGRVQPAQKDVHAQLEALGYRVGVVRSVDDVRAFCAEHGIPVREVHY